MFQEVLQEVVDNTDGGVAGLLMGYDGIPVDQYIRSEGSQTTDVESVGMEYSVILKSIMNAAEMLDVGKANEVAIRAERMITLIRFLTEDYFVAITMQPNANLGKARFLLRTRAAKLAADLS